MNKTLLAFATTALATFAGVATASADTADYTVQSGDTLSKIARDNNTNVQTLAQLNHISNINLIHVGQTLTFAEHVAPQQATPQQATPQANTTSYTVKAGDTLYRVALNHGTSVADLMSRNGITNPNYLRIGQVLQLTGSAPQQAQPKAPQQVVAPQNTQPTNTDHNIPTTETEQSAKDWIAMRESSGSYTAVNHTSGAYGRYQLMSYHLKYGTSIAGQERAADEYVHTRYGSWVNAKAFWLSHHWY